MAEEFPPPSSSRSGQNQRKKGSFVIEIPSYEEVLGSSQSKPKPPSLFTPSESFSQAFASIKNSEFYAPPPPPISVSLPSSRETGGSLAGSGAPVSRSTVQKMNAILVSHRQVQTSTQGSHVGPTYCDQPRIHSGGNTRNAARLYQLTFPYLTICGILGVVVVVKGNPLLKHIRNVRWNFADLIPDFTLGQNSCALYLSLRYHLLHPDYLYFRIRELQKNFRLRVILCHVDVEDVVKSLLEVTRTALLHDCTLLCGWSLEECGRYLETIKVYENKPADIIQGHMDSDYLSRLNHCLTAIRHVNKTDVVTLGSTFVSLSGIMDASMEDLARCPGIGERKVKRLYDTFHEPFKRVMPSRPTAPEAQTESDPTTTSSLATEDPDKDKDQKDKESKRQKKESELTIKSALSKAFAKYSEKRGKKTSQSEKESGEEGSNKVQPESETDVQTSGERLKNRP